jgi:hypothetical protein
MEDRRQLTPRGQVFEHSPRPETMDAVDNSCSMRVVDLCALTVGPAPRTHYPYVKAPTGEPGANGTVDRLFADKPGPAARALDPS